MKHSYLLDYGNGVKAFNIQEHLFTEEEMLNAFKKEGVVKVKYHRHIPSGWHLCGCGNLAIGSDERLLCKDCQMVYGHKYEYEL